MPIALVVEEDEGQRDFAAMLLEECEMEVIPCTSAEAAASVLEARDQPPTFIFTDAVLPGVLTGADLAHLVHVRYPDAKVVVTSGDQFPPSLPDGATFLPKPWTPLDLLREATSVS
ncbi:response regulator [Bradyrhizobium sp. LHD-71]|uniref:response regulator n=1 Tax=Bradyrhizobium sp. LHD-71 TaxID=3072141 RepID=UPI00280E933E|nr:response regulator [Bradyrhizobium sp. LHD-71]MDQ8729411.1 response regulator [Bradyrhizobium sp. LHD-71]